MIKNQSSLHSLFLSKTFDRKNFISWAVSLLFFLICYLLLRWIAFPDYRQVTEIELTEKLFELFEPPLLPDRLMPKEKDPDMTADQQKGLDVLKESNNEVLTYKDVEQFMPTEIQQQNVLEDLGGGQGIDFSYTADGVPLSGYSGDALMGDDALASVDLGLGGTAKEGKLGIESGIGEIPSLSGSGGSGLAGSGGGRGGGIGSGDGSGKKIATGSGVVVPFVKYGEGDYSGKDIVNPLIEWMKKHPKAHPWTMRNFLEYEPGDLTSVVEFTIQEQPIEIYLRCTDNTKELAICIIQKGNATKLIDQGISERSHKLEIGTVIRNETDNQIQSVNATNLSPTREKTALFMSIFLSWWNNGKPISS